MKRLLFFSMLIFPLITLGLDLKTNWHHIGPMMEAAKAPLQNLCADKSDLIDYISKEPKSEPWRSYYKLPKLLTKDFYKVKDVCEEAKKMNAAQGVDKEYALIANKSHFCDMGHRACISTLKSISDPCNYFVQDNFQVFHTRTWVGDFQTSGSQEITQTYGPMGPTLMVIRLTDCSLVPTEGAKKAMQEQGMSVEQAASQSYLHTPPSPADEKDNAGEPKFRSTDERVRFAAMKDSLLKTIPELQKFSDKRVDCYDGKKRILPGISDTDEVPYGKMKIPGLVAIRKLMDEQLIDVTGQSPYSE